jgi:hypothetical protein
MIPIDRKQMHHVFVGIAAIHAVAAIAFSLLILITDQKLLGVNAWIKPLKFALTGFMYLGTLAMFARQLPDSLTVEKGRRYAWWISVMIFGETFFVALQSARGVTSHFNQTTAVDGVIYSVMGVMIIVNTVYFVLMMLPFFSGVQRIHGAYLTGIRWGTMLFLFGSLVGGIMSGLNRHTIGIAAGGPGLPLVNFSTVGGDLRIAHFLGIHALQILPLAGWLISRWSTHERTQRRVIVATGVACALLLVGLFAQALLGKPLVAGTI